VKQRPIDEAMAQELAKMRAARAAMKPVTFGWPVLKGKSNG